jgi:Domain of unknown function (DUF6745)
VAAAVEQGYLAATGRQPEAVVWVDSRERLQALRDSPRQRVRLRHRYQPWWRVLGSVVAARWAVAAGCGLAGAVAAWLVGATAGGVWAAFTVSWYKGLAALVWCPVPLLLILGMCVVVAIDEWPEGLLLSFFLGPCAFLFFGLPLIDATRDAGELSAVGGVAAVAAALGAIGGLLGGLCIPSRAEGAAVALRAFDSDPALSLGETLWSRARDHLDPTGAAARVTGADAWACDTYATIAVLCAAPAEIAVEQAGGRARLHRAGEPAVRWPDGTVEYWWHGTQVPAGVVEGGWSAAWIVVIRDAEVRRAAIEMIGWPRFVQQAGLQLVCAAPDPGNPGHELQLYDLPDRFTTRPLRLLVMTNGSPDRDGRDRVYAETVPVTFTDPVEAAAWQYGVPVTTYRQLQRRT